MVLKLNCLPLKQLEGELKIQLSVVKDKSKSRHPVGSMGRAETEADLAGRRESENLMGGSVGEKLTCRGQQETGS